MTGSTRGTGNDPLDGVDPGGTRPTSAARRGKKPVEIEEKVQSGDRNTLNDSQGTPADSDPARNEPQKSS